MFKKYINSLLYEEQRKLISNNEKLLKQCRDFMLDNAYFWIDEYLTGCAGCRYSIGLDRGDYFTICDDISEQLKAVEWIESIQKSCAFFSDSDYTNIIEPYILSVNTLFYPYNITDNEYYNEIENNNTLRKKTESIILKRLQSEIAFCYDDNNVIDNGLEEWLLLTDNDNRHIYTDQNLTNIYEYIPEQIIPAHVETVI